MYRTIILISILMVNFSDGMTQGAMTYKYADSLTYRLYNEKNWGELIRKGREAVIEGHDYYYMRMRIGIAYYERHNYALSSSHFKKALAFNEADPVALEYLFYSYYLSGRTFQAWALLSEFNVQDRERITEESMIKKNSLTLETFWSNAGTEKIVTNPEIYFNNPEAGSQIATRYFTNNAIYLSHKIGRNASYSHSYTNLIKENYLHFFNGSQQADLPRQRINQNQYYGTFDFFTSSGWSISPSFHFLTARYPFITISNFGMNPLATTYKIRTNGYAAGLGLTKTGGYATLYGESVYTYINNSRQIQGTFSLMIYPPGNRNLYLGSKLSAVSGLDRSASGARFVKGFTAGFAVKGRIRFEFSGLSGDMKNYAENNGLIIYNSSDILEEKYNASIIIPFYKAGISLFAGGGISRYSSEFIPADGFNSLDPNRLSYKNYTITGGLSWNF